MSAIQIAKTTMICGAVTDSVAVGAVDEAVGTLHRRGEEGIGVEGEGVGVEGEGGKKMAAPMQPDDGDFLRQFFVSGKNDFHTSEEQKKLDSSIFTNIRMEGNEEAYLHENIKHTRKVSKI